MLTQIREGFWIDLNKIVSLYTEEGWEIYKIRFMDDMYLITVSAADGLLIERILKNEGIR